MSDNHLGKISYWDMKAESLGLCMRKNQANAKFIDIGYVSNSILRQDAKLDLSLRAIDVTKHEDQTVVNLYQADEKEL